MKNKKIRHSTFSERAFAHGFISRWLLIGAMFTVILSALFEACEYENNPAAIYNPSAALDTTGKPVITGITPATQAAAGVREITITGVNLTGTDTSWVIIGGASPVIKNRQSTSITFYRPALTSDRYDKPISVSVTDPTMEATSSNIAYYVETPGVVTGDYSISSKPLGGADFDSAGNVYVITNKTLYRIDFAGVTQTTLANSAALTSSDFNSPPFVCFGPASNNRNLFIAAANQSYIWRLAESGIFSSGKPVKLLVPSAVNTIDFDENGNLYTAGNGNFYVADKSVGDSAAPIFTEISGYAGVTNLVKIRIFNESSSGNKYIYIADSMHVWKALLSDSSLAMGAPLVDLSAHSELSGCTISSFDIDHNGSIFLCLQHNPSYSLFFVESDGSITPFYRDPNILPKTVDKLVWGNSNYLYLISSSLQSVPGTYASGRIYRMILDRNGAPYYGRNVARP